MNLARVHLLPDLATGVDFTRSTVVVVDILRATTTIVYALAAGATRVIPLLTVEQALARSGELSGQALLGGERGGRKIEGFHLGNSPAEYVPSVVAGKTLLFTTTNGTRAMNHCRAARRVLVGSFANFSATCRALIEAEVIDIVCAGTDGQVTREDVLFAGAVIDDLMRQRAVAVNDQAEIAADAWRSVERDFASLKPLAECLRASVGGRNLIEIGHERDIEIAAQIDRCDLVAELDLQAWEIRRRV